MKLQSLFKIILTFCLSLLLSCSSDGDGSNSLVLVKKVTTVGEESENIELIYQNNNLIKGVTGNSHIEFTYSGNKVTSSKRYVNEVLTRTNNFTYTGNLLTSITSDGVYPQKTVFFYINDKLSSIEYLYLSGTEWILLEKDEIQLDSNSNVSQLENMFNAGNEIYTSRIENQFDNKNNPLRDLNPYLRLFLNFINIDELSKNNVVSNDYFSPSNGTTSVNYTYEISYNENNFPIEIKRFSAEGSLITTTSIEYQ